MEASITKRDRGRARRGHTEPDKQVRPGKRHRSAEDEDAAGHTRKSPRIQESCHNLEGEIQSPPSRRSPRLQKIRDLKNQQQIARAGKQTKLSHRITKAHRIAGHKQSQAKRGFLGLARKSEQHCVHEDKFKNKEKPKSSLTNSEAQHSVKRRRSTENGDISDCDAKRPQYHDIREQACSTDEYIKNWLNTSCRRRRISPDNNTSLREASDDMPRKPADVLPSPSDTLRSTISPSRKSVKSAASASDTDYRKNSLRYRNIYIEREDPPVELIRRARRIISRCRDSPEIDDAAIQKLREISRKLQGEGEKEIIQQLVPDIIPAMKEIPDQKLAQSADKLWSNSVPIPLHPSVLISPLPLPKPKPDLVFGYSEAAFTRNQLAAIDLLVDDFGQSYAVPDQKLRFPFLDIEFKSQAKNGTHFIATNQVAGAGAIVLNGNLELIQRSFGAEKIDFDEPQFFSVTMDHELVRINVHWLSAPTDGGKYGFHVEGLLKHLLDDADGLRAIIRAIKNILDHGSDARLRKLCEALDAYRERVILERKAGTTERHQEPVIQTEPQLKRQRRSRGGVSTSTEAAGDAAGQEAS